MPFDWDNYLELALQLAGEDGVPNAEAKKRSAISRAYYSAFVQARAKAAARWDEDYPRRATHQWTQDKFQDDPEGQQVGVYLKRLQWRRKQADYDNSVPDLDSHLEDALLTAERIIKTVKELSDTMPDY